MQAMVVTPSFYTSAASDKDHQPHYYADNYLDFCWQVVVVKAVGWSTSSVSPDEYQDLGGHQQQPLKHSPVAPMAAPKPCSYDTVHVKMKARGLLKILYSALGYDLYQQSTIMELL